jgi:hypothetical protein
MIHSASIVTKVSFEISWKIRRISKRMAVGESLVKPAISPVREPNKKKSLGAASGE